MVLFLVEVDYYDRLSATVGTLYFASDPCTAANGTDYSPELLTLPSVARNAFGDGRTTGATDISIGELVIQNADGVHDAWADYAFDGREVRCYIGQATYTNIGQFTRYLTCVAEGMEFRQTETADGVSDQIVLRLMDKLALLDELLQPSVYAGSNAAGNGFEGDANLADVPKPLAFGLVTNVTPKPINPNKLLYQYHDGPAVVMAVYEGGAAITAGNDYPGQEMLVAASTAAGTYDTCIAAGMFKLGSSPTLAITCDAARDVSVSTWSTAGSFTFTVPNNVTQIEVYSWGAGGGRGFGGGIGGGGGFAFARLAVTPGEILTIIVGGPGGPGTGSAGGAGGASAQCTGGAGGLSSGANGAGGGGGSSAIRRSGTPLTIAAGGGGGGGSNESTFDAGAGGGAIGESGHGDSPGDGATQTAGDQGPGGGADGTQSTGGAGTQSDAGGGGGGWWGGEAGKNGGGGGGSSYVTPSVVPTDYELVVGSGKTPGGSGYPFRPASAATGGGGAAAGKARAVVIVDCTAAQAQNLQAAGMIKQVLQNSTLFGEPEVIQDETLVSILAEDGSAIVSEGAIYTTALPTYELGFYADAGMSIRGTLDAIVNSCHGAYSCSRLGHLKFVTLALPSGADRSYTTDDVVSLERVAPRDTWQSAGVHTIKTEYARNWTLMSDSQLATSISDDRKAFLTRETRITAYTSDTAKTAHRLAQELSFSTIIARLSEANTYTENLASLYVNPRPRFTGKLLLDEVTATIDIGEQIQITSSRFGLSAGPIFDCLGVSLDPVRMIVELDLHFGTVLAALAEANADGGAALDEASIEILSEAGVTIDSEAGAGGGAFAILDEAGGEIIGAA